MGSALFDTSFVLGISPLRTRIAPGEPQLFARYKKNDTRFFYDKYCDVTKLNLDVCLRIKYRLLDSSNLLTIAEDHLGLLTV